METVGVIPCAGKGTRLNAPFSKEVFPDLHHESYRPVIMYSIDAMKKAGIKHIIFTINPAKTDLLQYLGNGKQFGLDFTFCIHPEPKSLPQSVNEAYHLIKDKRVLFAMPDTVIRPNDFLAKALQFHEKNVRSGVTLGCFKAKDPTSVGIVEFNGKQVTNVIDKPKETDLKWMWGMMVWDPCFTEELSFFCKNSKPAAGADELILTDALHRYISSGRVYCYRCQNSTYRDLGTFREIRDWLCESRGKLP